MRIIILIFLIYSAEVSASSKFNLGGIFPTDINIYPILFLIYTDTILPSGFDSKNGIYLPKADARNKKIQAFIRSSTTQNHILVNEENIAQFNSEKYKYIVRTKLVEVYAAQNTMPTDNSYNQPKITKKFASLFYFENRQTGEIYKPYINPQPHVSSRSANNDFGLPYIIPSDRKFFLDLSDYINRLNSYGVDSVLTAEAKAQREREKTKKRMATGDAIAIGTVAFSASYLSILFFIIGNP